jgi:hypothetical protein
MQARFIFDACFVLVLLLNRLLLLQMPNTFFQPHFSRILITFYSCLSGAGTPLAEHKQDWRVMPSPARTLINFC